MKATFLLLLTSSALRPILSADIIYKAECDHPRSVFEGLTNKCQHQRGLFVETAVNPITPAACICICIRNPTLLLDLLGGFPVVCQDRRILTHTVLWMMKDLEKVLHHVALCGLPSEDRPGRCARAPAKPSRVGAERAASIFASAQLTFGFEKSPRAQRRRRGRVRW